MTARLIACPRLGCNNTQPCPDHAIAAKQASDRRRRGGYERRVYNSARWQRLRRRVLSLDPVCADCGVKEATDVDHKTPIAKAPELAFDESNLQALCAGCHTRKTNRQRGTR